MGLVTKLHNSTSDGCYLMDQNIGNSQNLRRKIFIFRTKFLAFDILVYDNSILQLDNSNYLLKYCHYNTSHEEVLFENVVILNCSYAEVVELLTCLLYIV